MTLYGERAVENVCWLCSHRVSVHVLFARITLNSHRVSRFKACKFAKTHWFFDKNEMVFYKSVSDLSEKVIKISSDDNLLKGELDFLLMQYIFDSLDLDNFNYYEKNKNLEDYSESYKAA